MAEQLKVCACSALPRIAREESQSLGIQAGVNQGQVTRLKMWGTLLPPP